MRSLSVVSVSWLFLGALVACGGTSTHGDGGAGSTTGGNPNAGAGGSSAGTTSAGGKSGAGAGGSSGGAGSSSCAATPPKNGSACTPRPSSGGPFGSAADCSWGDDPRPACRTFGVCNAGTWSITQPDASCSTAPRPAACPASPAKEGTTCADAMLQCWYDDGSVCSCSGCQGGLEFPICRPIDPPQWACVKPMDGCPNPAPQAGSACDDPNLQCGTSCELSIRCEQGAWQYAKGGCPMCAAPDTPIATPTGERPIAELRVGDLVYSVDDGAIVAVPIALVGSVPVSAHHVLRVTLDDGAVLSISPGHPLANGRPLSSLLVGDSVDEQHVVRSSELVPYTYPRTYDILPRSSSGSYFAAGALLGSTLSTAPH